MLAGLDESEFLSSCFPHPVVRLEPVDFVTKVVIDGLQLCELIVALSEAVVLAEVGLDREQEERGRKRTGNTESQYAEQYRRTRISDNSPIERDRAGQIANTRPAAS